jgi:AcrR family transcriptional regulator
MARPPSARAHQQVLDSALELFAQRGIDATSMDAISEASGVSKATIYKHWTHKDALCMEAFVRAHGVDDLPRFDSGNLRQDLIAFLEYRTPEQHAQMFQRLMPHFAAYATRNPQFRNAWKTRAMEPPRKRLRELLERGVKNGELRRDLNIEVGIALLLGPMMYRFAVYSMAADLPKDLPRLVVDSFLMGHAVQSPGAGAKKTSPRPG